MTIFLFVIIYAAAAVFLLACIVRILRFARTPIHLRWELVSGAPRRIRIE